MHLRNICLDKNNAKWSYAPAETSSEKAGIFPTTFQPSQASDLDWKSAQAAPTEIFVDLLRDKKIPDPYKKDFEKDVQWVGETDWVYKAEFSFSKSLDVTDIVIEGLDTYATVWLNSKKILESENAFVSRRVDVTDTIITGNNEILIHFASAFLKGRDLEKKYGKMQGSNGDISRVYVRKPQYHYGWDWGPVLLTAGPWKPIRLEDRAAVRFGDMFSDAQVSESLESSLQVSYAIEHTKGFDSAYSDLFLEATLKEDSASKRVLSSKHSSVSSASVKLSWNNEELQDIKLWWPSGYGDQNLYNVETILKEAKTGRVIDRRNERFGFRRVEVVQDKFTDQPGTSFYFKVNNVPIYAAGCNWIPGDSFLTNISPSRYREWLELAKSAHFNMVRVWGGGIFETESFYDACDELGLLLWQDFMFGCAAYPAHDEFVKSVQPELEQAVKRLRNHPCLSAIVGNNEDYALMEQEGYKFDPNVLPSQDKELPARLLYEEIMPKVVRDLSPSTFYQPSSPWGGIDVKGSDTTDQTRRDIHQISHDVYWNVWHGSQEKYQEWDKLTGRFVSEFGMEGYPDIKTVNFWFDGDNSQRYPQSKINAAHNKASGYERRTETYVVENFRHNFDMDCYIYITQLMQSEAMYSAYSFWRREWRGSGKEYNGGALVWQLNDCWPTVSWSIVDYFLRPKPAYFSIKRACEPVTINMKRFHTEEFENERTGIPKMFSRLQVWACNSTPEEVKVNLIIEGMDIMSGNKLKTPDEIGVGMTKNKAITLKPNCSTEIWEGVLPGSPEESDQTVISARISDCDNDAVISRALSYAEPFKFLRFPSPEVTDLKVLVSKNEATKGEIKINAKRPVKGLIFSNTTKEIKLSDNALDIFPDDEQVIQFEGDANAKNLQWRYYGDLSTPRN